MPWPLGCLSLLCLPETCFSQKQSHSIRAWLRVPFLFLISFATVKTLGDVCRDLKKDSRIQHHVCLALHQSVHR